MDLPYIFKKTKIHVDFRYNCLIISLSIAFQLSSNLTNEIISWEKSLTIEIPKIIDNK